MPGGVIPLVEWSEVDDVGLEIPGCVVTPPGTPLTGGGSANAYDIIPIASAKVETAIGNFMRGEQLQRHNVKINGFYPPWLR